VSKDRDGGRDGQDARRQDLSSDESVEKRRLPALELAEADDVEKTICDAGSA
jgi:hypothetical protein